MEDGLISLSESESSLLKGSFKPYLFHPWNLDMTGFRDSPRRDSPMTCRAILLDSAWRVEIRSFFEERLPADSVEPPAGLRECRMTRLLGDYSFAVLLVELRVNRG